MIRRVGGPNQPLDVVPSCHASAMDRQHQIAHDQLWLILFRHFVRFGPQADVRLMLLFYQRPNHLA